ncbi:hypothetical protein [Streptomyces sp. NPDC088115]|uniref:hypothetical protein n=1 Tax=Streptomyces sp. NPDC088115 TaxID=3365824 RepID=UPI00380F2F9D
MSDFQDRRPAHRDPAGSRGPGGQRPRRRGEEPGPVHQAVFRWEGNQGRQGTGMKAVAYSCPAELADELGRELGPLLWVSGTAAPYPSVVRTRTADGRIMLVRRWPTTDRGGRPSTVSHALIGDARTLGTENCLGLAHGGWGSTRESAEQASGERKPVAFSQLTPLVSQRLPGMTNQLASVRSTLVLVAAEWLRDPEQRVSLLTNEVDPGGGLDPAEVPLVYLGLYRLFGSWLGQDWTFATYDTSDTHQLRLMCVSRWEPDAGGSGPLARVTGRMAGEATFEHAAAARLVDHLLAHPAAAPGVPQLTELLRDGAALGRQRRRARLQEILFPEHRRGARTAASPRLGREADPAPEGPGRFPEPSPAPEGPGRFPEPSLSPEETDRYRKPSRAPEPEPERPDRTPEPERRERPERIPEPERPDRPDRVPEPERSRAPEPDYTAEGPLPRAPEAEYGSRTPPGRPASPWAERAATAPAERPEPLPEPFAPPPPGTPPTHSAQTPHPATAPPPHHAEPPGSGYPRLPGGYTPAPAARETPLREALHGLRRGDTAGHDALAERLRGVSDERLLAELRSEGLPQAPLELLLNELGSVGRTSTRPEPMRHELCGEVLRHGLYFTPNRPGSEAVTRMSLAAQSARLFSWAVAPLARDGRYLLDLQELLHRMSRDRDLSAGSWLRQSITDPPSGVAPDLPPALWQQLLRDTATRTTSPYQAPRTPQPPLSPLTPAPVSPSAPQESPGWRSRITERTNQAGCVVGCTLGLLAVLIAVVVVFV